MHPYLDIPRSTPSHDILSAEVMRDKPQRYGFLGHVRTCLSYRALDRCNGTSVSSEPPLGIVPGGGLTKVSLYGRYSLDCNIV